GPGLPHCDLVYSGAARLSTWPLVSRTGPVRCEPRARWHSGSSYSVGARSPDRAPLADRRSPFTTAEETYGRCRGHGQETVPQRGDRAPTRVGTRAPSILARARAAAAFASATPDS